MKPRGEDKQARTDGCLEVLVTARPWRHVLRGEQEHAAREAGQVVHPRLRHAVRVNPRHVLRGHIVYPVLYNGA